MGRDLQRQAKRVHPNSELPQAKPAMAFQGINR
jgi:hypothetical protein